MDLSEFTARRASIAAGSQFYSRGKESQPESDSPLIYPRVRHILNLVDYFDPRLAVKTPDELLMRGIKKRQFDKVLRPRRSDSELYLRNQRTLITVRCPLCGVYCETVNILQNHLNTH